jgi:hypothetical protein
MSCCGKGYGVYKELLICANCRHNSRVYYSCHKAEMHDPVILFVHAIVTLSRQLGPGGIRFAANSLSHQSQKNCFLCMKTILRLLENNGMRRVNYRFRYFLAPVRRQTVHKNVVGFGMTG